MDILLSKYGLIFTEFDSIDRGGACHCHVTVLHQWLSEKNTDYIIKRIIASHRTNVLHVIYTDSTLD